MTKRNLEDPVTRENKNLRFWYQGTTFQYTVVHKIYQNGIFLNNLCIILNPSINRSKPTSLDDLISLFLLVILPSRRYDCNSNQMVLFSQISQIICNCDTFVAIARYNSNQLCQVGEFSSTQLQANEISCNLLSYFVSSFKGHSVEGQVVNIAKKNISLHLL